MVSTPVDPGDWRLDALLRRVVDAEGAAVLVTAATPPADRPADATPGETPGGMAGGMAGGVAYGTLRLADRLGGCPCSVPRPTRSTCWWRRG
ncbi:hypothetical protein [Nonomuraea salmonea]|uniref:hypothetical protein n=1 Tax=Nonomuraea salmonea TaxID=46181 RepID=UPI002FE75C6A